MSDSTHSGSRFPHRVAAADTNRLASDPPSEEVLGELDRILASHSFRRANRLKSLLRFLVAQGLARNDSELEAYPIGREVFGKPDEYNSRIDPHVRVEASRLRERLRKYYETEGRADPITIAIRKGSYRPLFERREPPRPHLQQPAPSTLTLSGPARLAPSTSDPLAAGSHDNQALSIIVLPFVDLSPKGDQGYFCDGLTVEIINKLARVDGLKVVARSSAFQFRGAAQDIGQIREKLNVGAIVEGSVRKENERLRITLHLIDSSNGYLIWTDEFEGPLKGVLALQDQIAAAIVRLFRVRLRERRTISPPHTRPPEAIRIYNHYLKGLYHLSRRTESGLRRAIACFDRVLAKDPAYAPALAQLANCYVSLAISSAVSSDEVMPRAKAAALKALEFDQSLPDAHAALAFVRALYDRDWRAAEQGFRFATHIAPRLPTTEHWYAIGYLVPLGELDDAAARLAFAHQLDPLSIVINTHLGVIAYMKGCYDQAVEQLKTAIALDPKFYRAYWDLGRVYVQQCRFDEAVTVFEKARPLAGGAVFRLGSLGYCLARQGKKAKALEILDELRQSSRKGHTPAYDMAEIHVALGDKEQAFELLEQAYEDRSLWLARLKVDPVFDEVRTETAFVQLVRKMGLED